MRPTFGVAGGPWGGAVGSRAAGAVGAVGVAADGPEAVGEGSAVDGLAGGTGSCGAGGVTADRTGAVDGLAERLWSSDAEGDDDAEGDGDTEGDGDAGTLSVALAVDGVSLTTTIIKINETYQNMIQIMYYLKYNDEDAAEDS